MSNTDYLNELIPYMLIMKNISKFPELMNETKKVDKPTQKKNIIDYRDNIFFPQQSDQLFWCVYITIFGHHEYDMIHNFFTVEKDIKYRWVEELRTKREILKLIKVSRSVVEDELTNCKKISMKTVKALCHLFDINFVFIDNKKYYEIITNENKRIDVVEQKAQKFGLKQAISMDKLEYYRAHYWRLENLDKPLKCISNYKTDELKDICKKLHIDYSKMTKPVMYQSILACL